MFLSFRQKTLTIQSTMPILYAILLFFSASGFMRKFADTKELMSTVWEESKEAGHHWVLFSLGLGWFAVLGLTLHARVKFGLPLAGVVGCVLLKTPALISGLRFFETGHYSRRIFIFDKVDLGTNLSLCGFALYRYSSVLFEG